MGSGTICGGCLLWAQGSGEIITQKKTALTPETQMCEAGHCSRGSLVVGTREWSNCYSDGTTSALISQTKMAKDHSCGPLTMGTREWRDYFSNGRGQPSQAKSGPPNTTRLCYCKGPCRSCSSAIASSTCHL